MTSFVCGCEKSQQILTQATSESAEGAQKV
jgi:hypothetical protein